MSRNRRKPCKIEMRGRWLLQRLVAFVKRRGWYPSATELAAFTGRGSRWTTWRDLRSLLRMGFVRMERRRWTIIDKGFHFLGYTPFFAHLPQKPSKKCAAETRRRRLRVRAAWARRDLGGGRLSYERFVEGLALRNDFPTEG